MVRPPEAEPVRADRALVDAASETRGPPPTPSTASRTTAKAGIAATTAPNPTRLATLRTGSTDALAPASTLSRKLGNRARLSRTTVRQALARATATDHTPATAAKDVAPQRASPR